VGPGDLGTAFAPAPAPTLVDVTAPDLATLAAFAAPVELRAGTSPAMAWTLAAKSAASLTIAATLERLDSTSALQGTVRLIHASQPGPDARVAVNAADHVLGATDEAPLSFPVGAVEATLNLGLPSHQIGANGVGKYVQSWEGWFRADGAATWTSMGPLTVDVYVLADRPQPPWADGSPPGPPALNLPWPEALDHAAKWASGATTTTATVEKLLSSFWTTVAGESLATARFYYKGDGSKYQTGTTAYATFALQAFLDDLDKTGESEKLNCDDVSGIVAVMGALLGCPICRVRIEDPPEEPTLFAVHDCSPLGWGRWDSLSGAVEAAQMEYHATCHFDAGQPPPVNIADLVIYELCFQLDTDGNPSSADPAHVPVFPAGMTWASYLDAFVDHPAHSWDQSTTWCGALELGDAPAVAVEPRLTSTVATVADTLGRRDLERVVTVIERFEQFSSAVAGQPMRFETTSGFSKHVEEDLKSVVLRFRGPRPWSTASGFAPSPPGARLNAWDLEIHHSAGGGDMTDGFVAERAGVEGPGVLQIDLPRFKAYVFGGGEGFLLLIGDVLLRLRRNGQSGVADLPLL